MTDLSHLRGLIERAKEARALANLSVPGEPAWAVHTPAADAAEGHLRRSALEALPALLDEIERLRLEMRWIELFAQMRSEDDSKTFARVNRGALRTISERARLALTPNKEPDHG